MNVHCFLLELIWGTSWQMISGHIFSYIFLSVLLISWKVGYFSNSNWRLRHKYHFNQCHNFLLFSLGAVNNLPMGYPIMHQSLIPSTGYPQINSMGTISSCHGVKGILASENFLHMQQNCAKEWVLHLPSNFCYYFLRCFILHCVNCICHSDSRK